MNDEREYYWNMGKPRKYLEDVLARCVRELQRTNRARTGF